MRNAKCEVPGENRETRNAQRDPPSRRRTRFQRLRRRAFHLAALGSAGVLVAILVLWPLSYFRYDAIRHVNVDTTGWNIASDSGRVQAYQGGFLEAREGFSHFSLVWASVGGYLAWSYADATRNFGRARYYRFLGCECVSSASNNPARPVRWIYIPYSYLALLSAITPAVWLLTRQRRRREAGISKGLCPLCGYDLRGHATIPDARCPECGTPVSATAPAK